MSRLENIFSRIPTRDEMDWQRLSGEFPEEEFTIFDMTTGDIPDGVRSAYESIEKKRYDDGLIFGKGAEGLG